MDGSKEEATMEVTRVIMETAGVMRAIMEMDMAMAEEMERVTENINF